MAIGHLGDPCNYTSLFRHNWIGRGTLWV